MHRHIPRRAIVLAFGALALESFARARDAWPAKPITLVPQAFQEKTDFCCGLEQGQAKADKRIS